MFFPYLGVYRAVGRMIMIRKGVVGGGVNRKSGMRKITGSVKEGF